MTSNMPIDICGPLPRFRQRQQPEKLVDGEPTPAVTPAWIKDLNTADSEEIERFSRDELVSILEQYLL
ncbi:hypothetical protein F0L74_17655 [Chitinophaga agrisoli]|uniref:Uncharacterized protein n=1 Tax=Chitinophaga agrisoli TaxID=2607653 RepID=A0A5B2VR65_9BACT|nr:hypothetical protein [Chitinophaga agrisoli]KAA2241701.1 hypothetical protein F0L74_17655 [Chitinophaga agrisoli]